LLDPFWESTMPCRAILTRGVLLSAAAAAVAAAAALPSDAVKELLP